MNDTVEIGYFLLHGEEVIKIGFLNNGEFFLQVYPEKGITSLDDWVVLFLDKKSKIFNAGGMKLTPGRMIDLIQEYQV